jgi:hypothetical protein
MSDGREAGVDRRDSAADVAGPDATCSSDAPAKRAVAQACGCDADCASGHCTDGVCCSTACNEGCKTCAAAGSEGTCTARVVGAQPRDATTCKETAASTCGFDGTCDGAGGCRRHVSGTICKAGTCDGAAVTGAFACDGAGRCRPGPTTICAPYSCDTNTGACFNACSQSNQCVSGQQCVSASCGKKMKGATCTANADCASGFCADGVCCNVACQGGCVSCATTGRLGTCWPIDQGVPDPRAVCKDQGAASCGANGKCDGYGGCEKYATETVCLPASCTGTRRNTPGTCDGNGTCRPQGVRNCAPFLCADGLCTESCKSDADCESGHACVGGQCGKRSLGTACAGDGDCASNMCVDGVCCNSACTGGCLSCALSSAMGHCTPIATGAVDPRGVCTDLGATSCSTNGRCDGAGGCQKYKEGTLCAPETCAGNVYTPASVCSATGQCTPPDSLPCAPFVCNGSACFNACTSDQNCVSPNVCNGNSCGKKMRGASCSQAGECQTGFCAQGVCCDTACDGACAACALPGTLGTCTAVPNGAPDPAGLCADMGPGGCGTNGRCQAGACQKYLPGTACKDSTCPAQTTMFTPTSSCDGAGACVTPQGSTCFPFKCGSAVCKASCTSDADCAAPAVCTGGSCGLKQTGNACAEGMECLSGFCAQGVCCNSNCNGTCQSCALPAKLGLCSNVADGGTDPHGRCADQGQASCGTDGVCDGSGACRVYAAGTACAAASCAAGSSTLTLTRTCDGAGTCKPATTQACAPFLCNGVSACKAACTVDADCLLPNICDPQTNLCGNKRRLGQTCAQTSDCLTGNSCVDGVCCSSASCGLCQSCAVPGLAGSCANVASGAVDPHGGCPANPPCGNSGTCNGAGACAQAGVGVACGTASCAGSTYTPVSHCTGTGACAAPTTSGCSPYVCGTSACLTVCATDGDCVAPFTCQGTGSTRSCALKANGLTCTGGGQCISGNCVDGVCCGSASCPACQACNVSGTGACAPVAAGTAAPATFCSDQGATTCGTNGKCDGAGGCQKYIDGTTCSVVSCPAGAAAMNLAGSCAGGTCSVPTQSCAPYFCNGAAACRTTCNTDADCAGTHYCTGAGGTCQPKIAQGTACSTDHQCGTNHCVDGVCCGVAACGSCQACNVGASAGSCAPVAVGTSDPKGLCATQSASTCGTTGKCDGAGGCQKHANGTSCATASCPAGGTTLSLAGTCSNGSCSVTTQSCAPYFCNGAGACRTTCNSDGDCAGTHYCTGVGGTCQPKIVQGVACATDHQCGTNHCVDGVCCGVAACGSCQACNVGASAGACAPVGAGTIDPKGVCADNLPASCGNNGRCDGVGGCQKYGDGTSCSSPSCPAGGVTLTLGGTCAGGTCTATPQSCNGYRCNGTNACQSTCNADGDCASGYYCTGATGSCLPKIAQGLACASDHQCGTAHCVDGVCCGTASCGSCQACNVGAGAGSCAPVGAGTTDPKGVCTNAGGCGTNGKCDGNGACQKYADGTGCSSPSCPAGSTTLTLGGTCGGGACGTTTQSCGAFKCDGSQACRTTCNSDGDCADGNFCALMPIGTCTAKLALGAACTAGSQCGSGNCVDGACCGSAACPACQVCDLSGTGTCSAVAAGDPDPHGGCAAQAASTCGRTGLCSGTGSCQTYANGTACSNATCPAGATSLTLGGTCSGGTCQAGTQSCNGHLCGGGAACPTTCNGGGDCASGFYCTSPGGTCQAKVAQGGACTEDGQCGTGHCVDYTCCGTETCGQCNACNVAGSLGTCHLVAADTFDPRGVCQNTAATSCTENGKCTAAGACQTFDCGAYKCDGASSCRSTCASDNDCTAGNFCLDAGTPFATCTAKLTKGEVCTTGNPCGTGNCVDGHCCGAASCDGCHSCGIDDHEGDCYAKGAGADSNGLCADDGSDSCQQNGKCNGSGGCQLYVAGTVCVDAFCTPTTSSLTNARTCDGNGLCSPATMSSCGAYQCKADATACNTDCASDLECSTGYACNGLMSCIEL